MSSATANKEMPPERGQGCICAKHDQVLCPSKYGFKRLNLARSLWVSINREATSKTIHRPELDKLCKTRTEEQQKKKRFCNQRCANVGAFSHVRQKIDKKTNFCCLSLFSVIFIDGLFQVLFSPNATKSHFLKETIFVCGFAMCNKSFENMT